MKQAILNIYSHPDIKSFSVRCNLYPYYLHPLGVDEALCIVESVDKRKKFHSVSNLNGGTVISLQYPTEGKVNVKVYNNIHLKPSIIECNIEDVLILAKRLKIGIVDMNLSLGGRFGHTIKGKVL